MGNRSSSASKRQRDDISADTSATTSTMNGTKSTSTNDSSSTQTRAGEMADRRLSLNLTVYRSISDTDQVVVMFHYYLVTRPTYKLTGSSPGYNSAELILSGLLASVCVTDCLLTRVSEIITAGYRDLWSCNLA